MRATGGSREQVICQGKCNGAVAWGQELPLMLPMEALRPIPIAFASTDLHEEPRSVVGKGLEFKSHTSLSMGSRALTETREKAPGESSPKV